MIFNETKLKGAYIIEPEPNNDKRGFFLRVFCKKEFNQKGLMHKFVQANHSGTYKRGIIRGMHYQLPPCTEVKLVKCIKGKIYDVIIDVRADSQTFLNWYGIELSEENKRMLYIPQGFAHGFQNLTEISEMLYLVSSAYSPENERGIRYTDLKIDINWPIKKGIVTSEKDANLPLINENFAGVSL